jgi:hypothetical protein
MPTSVTGNIVCSCYLPVPGQPENDMIIGTGAYKPGYDSTMLRPVTDAGPCWLKAVMSCPGLHCQAAEDTETSCPWWACSLGLALALPWWRSSAGTGGDPRCGRAGWRGS